MIEESTEDGDTGTPEQKLKQLRDKLKVAEGKAAEYLAGWQRAKADYVNLEKRMRSMGTEVVQSAMRAAAVGFIDIADSLEAASKTDKGLGAVLRQLDEAFKASSVARYTPTVGEAFNPVRHESVGVLATNTEEEDNTISEVMQSGYELEGAVIRPARVVVKHYQS